MSDNAAKKTNQQAKESSILKDLPIPPHNLNFEQSLLVALMSLPQSFEQVDSTLNKEDFYAVRHQHIFDAIHSLARQDLSYDVIMVSDRLSNLGLLDAAGGDDYLHELMTNTASHFFKLEDYAQKIKDFATLRQLIQAGNEINNSAYHPKNRSVDDILDVAESRIFAIAEQRHASQKSGPQKINDINAGLVAKLTELSQADGDYTGLNTGFLELNNKTSGLQPGDLVIVAARPSMGKTTFAMNMVEGVLFGHDLPVLVFSMEMPSDSIAMRMMSSIGKIEQTSVRSGKLKSHEWESLSTAMAQLADRPLYIDDTPALSPSEVRSRARRVAAENGNKMGLIMVDYLQLMRVPGMGDNRVNEVAEISRSLKALAKELKCPVVALSQLSRNLENRPNKRPVMSDLRESGAIEQDADVIMFIYRDEVYNKESKDVGTAEIIIGKQRNGPIGTVRLAFEGHFTRFRDLDPSWYDMHAREGEEE
ncbi:MAG: replicative DNA helicase [Acinetobacter sp.]|nr:replicative DNA helicase [Acinetobacter sp.]